MNILELRNVKVSFGGFQVLAGIDLSIREGERHAIIGPNGAGKSTLFNIISGLFAPTAGEVLFRGHNISGVPAHRIAQLGLSRSFQIINIFPALSVFENVRSAVTARHRLNWSFWRRLDRMEQVTQEADEILERVGLLARRDVRANALSYGEQRRLEIGLTIGLRPDLVLLDEPCSGLNAEDTERAIALVRRLTEGKTLMMVEHDMNVVFGLADRISVIHYGKVLATGSAEEIRGNPEVQRSYLARRAGAARA